MPAGGIGAHGQLKIRSKKFFIPVKVLSRKFRGKFLHKLKRAFAKLEFKGKYEKLYKNSQFHRLIDSYYRKEWVVYSLL